MTALTRLLAAADSLAQIGTGNRSNPRVVADAWKNANGLHFQALARHAKVRVDSVTFTEFFEALEKRAVAS